MSNTVCAVFGCSNTRNNCKTLKPNVKFYSFNSNPHQKERMRFWAHFTKRKNDDGSPWVPNKYSVICSEHFIGNAKSEHPHHPSYNPTIRPNEEPTVDANSKVERFNRRRSREDKAKEIAKEILNDHLIEENIEPPEIKKKISTLEMSTQTDEEVSGQLTVFNLDIINMNEKSTQVTHRESPEEAVIQVERSFNGFQSIKNSEKKLKDLTAVSLDTFNLLLSLVPHYVVKKNSVSREDKLLIVLMKLKLDLSFLSLSRLFGVSPQTITYTFHSILDVLCQKTTDWIFWPSSFAIQATMPESFKEHYPETRVIIDCTEIKTETPPKVEMQVQMWSNYKSSYTVKYLIGIAPNGLVIFISKAYGGRSTDTYITTNCGILEKLEIGDVVLSDKGFPNLDIQDGITVVMPPFSSSKSKQFTAKQMVQTYNVACVRIHVERSIQRLKVHKVLTNRLSIDMLPVIDKIVHVCCVLTNLQFPIIKQH